MEDKKLTPQESMELITSMIQSTKQKIASPDLTISTIWTTLIIITTTIVWGLQSTTQNPLFNFVWFAIPVIGIPANILLSNKKRNKSITKTYIDNINKGMWQTILYVAAGLTVACLISHLCGYPKVWLAMFYYSFIIVGFGTSITGLILRENSFVFGGIFSILSGFIVIICELCNISILYTWIAGLYILCLHMMYVVPIYIISRKIKETEE